MDARLAAPWLAALGAAAMSVPGPAAARADGPGRLVGAGGLVAGRSYAQWERALWTWRLGFHRLRATAPGRCIGAGQRSPVWFVGVNATSEPVLTVRCHIPAGRFVMLGVPSYECSTAQALPFYALTDAGLADCAARSWREHFLQASLQVDGRLLGEDGGVAVATGAFFFSMPWRDNYLNAKGHTTGRVAVFAHAAILRPFSPGRHTVVSRARLSCCSERTVYRLTVG